MRKIIEFLLIFLASAQIHAAEPVQIPPQCQSAVGTVALIDCLRNQQEIISQLHEYYSITAQIRKLQAEQGAANAPPAAVPSADHDSDAEMNPGIERANWFDQELEVYAVVGTAVRPDCVRQARRARIPIAGRRFNPPRQSVESASAGRGTVGCRPRNFSRPIRPISTSSERKWRVIFQITHCC